MNGLLRLSGLVSVVLAVVLVPFALVGSAVDDWAIASLRTDAGPSVLVAVLIATLLAADIVLPTPSSVVSTASGALLGFIPGAVASWVGVTMGCALGYWIGVSGRGPARRLVGAGELKRVEAFTARFGDWSLVLLPAVPVLAESSVFLAGVARMDLARFVAITALSNAGISLAYAAVGAFATQTSSFLLAFGGAILLPAVALGLAGSLGCWRST